MSPESPEPVPCRAPGRDLGARAALLLLGIALAVLAAAYLTTPNLLSGVDFLRIHAFYKGYWAEAVRAGRWLPLWNPHVNLGRPFLADADAGIFYPPDLLFLVWDAAVAWAVLACLHLWLMMLGMARWLRAVGADTSVSLLVACILPVTAPVAEVLQGGMVHYAIGLCFLPWVFLLATRLSDSPSWVTAAKLAGVVSLQYLGGHPQVSWLAWLGATTFVLVRRLGWPVGRSSLRAGRDALAVSACFGFGFAIAAVQILPTLELAGQGNRQGAFAFAASFALPPVGLLSLIEPLGPHFLLDSTSDLFCGTAVLLTGLAGLARLRDRNVRALAALALVSLLLALGPLTPFFRLCHALVPGCSSFRLHSRAMMLFLLALLAGAGLLVSQRQPQDERRVVYLGAAVLLALVLLQVGLRPSLLEPQGGATSGLRLLLVGATTVLLWLRQRSQKRPRPRLRAASGIAVVVLLAVELSLSLHGIKRIRAQTAPADPERMLARVLAEQGLLQPHRPPPRVSFPMPYVRENAGMAIGFSTFSGYVSLTLERVFAFIYGMRGLQEPLRNTFPADNVYGHGPFPFASMNLQVGFDPERGRLFMQPTPDPRVYLAESVAVVGGFREALQRMRAGHDFHRTVLLEQPVPSLTPAATGSWSGEATVQDFTPEQLRIATRSSHDAWLVVAETWYPGWTATVDGRPAPCLPGNVWMRAVPVPAGAHEVVLSYRSSYLAPGALISILCLFIVAVVGVGARWRRSRGGSTTPRSAPVS